MRPLWANGQLVFPSEKKDHYVFRLTIPNKTTFDQISCSVPVDRSGNREEDGVCPGGKSPSIFETALIKDDEITYVVGLKYDIVYGDGIRTFETFQEVADEICRLITTDDSAMVEK